MKKTALKDISQENAKKNESGTLVKKRAHTQKNKSSNRIDKVEPHVGETLKKTGINADNQSKNAHEIQVVHT